MFPVYVHQGALATFDALPPAQRRKLLDWKLRLEANPLSGSQLPKARTPKSLRAKYAISNLWRLPLPEGWRALYTIVAQDQEKAVLFLWIGTHKEYDRLLGYRTS